MAKFAENYPDGEIVQEALAQLKWYHNIAFLDKVKDVGVSVRYVSRRTG